MTEFAVKPFELSEYNVGAFIVKNPRNSKYEIISEYQAELLQKLQEGESVAQMLFPNTGIATSRHFDQCVSLFIALRDLELVERKQVDADSEVTTKTFSFTRTLTQLKTIRFGQGFAEFVLTFKGKILAMLPIPLLIFLPIAFLAGSILLFPMDADLKNAFNSSNWWVILLSMYSGVCLSLSTRQIFRSGFLQAIQRKITDMRFVMNGPFLSLAIDDRDTWMGGHRARLQIAMVGLLSTFFISFLSMLLLYFQLIPLDFSLAVFFSSVLAFGLCSFPFFKGDGEELLHLLMFGHKLECSLAKDCRAFIQKFYDLSLFRKRVLWAAIAATVWSIAWVDLWSSAAMNVSRRLAADIFSGGIPMVQAIPAYLVILVLGCLILFPALFFVWQSIVGILLRREAAAEASVVAEIDWEEKRRRLSRIPLFAALSEATRIHLLEEMENHTFKEGEYLVKQGQHGAQLFVMLHGEAQAIFKDATGKSHVVGTLRDGDTFGEVALIDQVPRTASVLATKECTALSLSREDFEKHIANDESESSRVKQMIRLSSFFKRHPLFSRMQAVDQAKIIERFRFNTVVANEELNGKDVKEPRFFLVYTGKLMVGDMEEDFLLSSEDCFGFLAPGQNPAYLPSVKAFEGSGLLSLSQRDFRDLVWTRIASSMEFL